MDIFEDMDNKEEKPLMESSPIGVEEKGEASIKKDPKAKKKNILYISLIVVLVLVLIASSISIGVLIGARTGINKDMPMLIEAYDLIKKYYYQDITWEEFQEIATGEVVNSLDPFTFMINSAVPVSTKRMGFTLSITPYNNLIISFITPGSGAANAKATRRVLQSNPDKVEEIADVEKQYPLQIGDEIYSIFHNGEWVQVQHAQAGVFQNLVNQSGDFVKIRVIKHGLVYRLPNGSDALSEDLFYFEYIIKKGDVDNTQAFYYSPTEICKNNERQDVAMIKLLQFDASAPKDFRDCVVKFLSDPNKPSKLILDLRGNGGGGGDILAYIANFLLDVDGPTKLLVGSSKQAKGDFRDEPVYSTNIYNYEGEELDSAYLGDMVANFEVAVLVDGNSASSSEVLTYNLMFHNNAPIIGSKTFGKGVMQKVFLINGGKQELLITNGKYYLPETDENGITTFTKNIHGEGITPKPEHTVNATPKPYKSDLYIRKAIEVFK